MFDVWKDKVVRGRKEEEFWVIGCVLFQNRTNLDRSDLSDRRGHGHLVLVCTECCKPRPLLQINRLRRRPASQMGVAKSDFLRRVGADQIWLKNAESFPRIDLDRSRFVRFWKECNHYKTLETDWVMWHRHGRIQKFFFVGYTFSKLIVENFFREV